MTNDVTFVFDEFNKEKPVITNIKEETLRQFINYWARIKNLINFKTKTTSKKKLKKLNELSDMMVERTDSTMLMLTTNLIKLDSDSELTDELVRDMVMYITYQYTFGNKPIQILSSEHVENVISS